MRRSGRHARLRVARFFLGASFDVRLPLLRACLPQRMLLVRAASARLRPPSVLLRRRLVRSAMSDAVVSVTEVHATRWLRCAVRAPDVQTVRA